MSDSKNIVLLSDGTGNAANKVWKSNVWRVFESLDLRATLRLPSMTTESARRHSNPSRSWAVCSAGD